MGNLVKSFDNPSLLKYSATRDGFGEGLVLAGKKDQNLFVISADLTESTRVDRFEEAYPDRFIEIGVSEQLLAGLGAGLALEGKTAVLASYAVFSPGRNWEQIRTTIALQNLPVIIAGGHAGLTVGEDGATHQMLEDLAIMRVLPNITVISPCDAIEARKAILASVEKKSPIYLRLSREKSPIFTTEQTPFAIGKASVLTEGNAIGLLATGPLVYQALLASTELKKSGIDARVINVSSIKPLDEETILACARECRAIITIEEAQIAGGLGGAVCEFLSETYPTRIHRLGVVDRFGESGSAQTLLEQFHLTANDIVTSAKKLVRLK